MICDPSQPFTVNGAGGGGSAVFTFTPDGNTLSGKYSYEGAAGPILLTLNETASIDPAKILRTFTYGHPAYSSASIVAQRRYKEISGRRRTSYCGAYWGYGFHEDGVNSALAVADHFGITLEACTMPAMREFQRI